MRAARYCRTFLPGIVAPVKKSDDFVDDYPKKEIRQQSVK
jgi:hypothetical protein